MPFQIIDPATGEIAYSSGDAISAPTVVKAPPATSQVTTKAPAAPVSPTAPVLVSTRPGIFESWFKAQQAAAPIIFAAGPATQAGAPSGTIPTSGLYQAGPQTGYIPAAGAAAGAAGVHVRAPAATPSTPPSTETPGATVGGLSMGVVLPIAVIGALLLMRR